MQIVFKLRVAKGFGLCSADLLFSRIVEMPYVPPVGMEVIEGYWCAKVDSLVFANGLTFAFVEDGKARGERTASEMDELEKACIDDGWQKSERLLGI